MYYSAIVVLLCLTSKGYVVLQSQPAVNDMDMETGPTSTQTSKTKATSESSGYSATTEYSPTLNSVQMEQDEPLIPPSTGNESDGYVVKSPSCAIPDTNPFDESIKHLYAKQLLVQCGSMPQLTSVSRTEHGHVLQLHKEHFGEYDPEKELKCYYQQIQRGDKDSKGADDAVKYGPLIEFQGNVTFNQEDEFIHVRCDVKSDGEVHNKYKNMHGFVGLKPEVVKKMRESDERAKKDAKPLSVMIIGFDSISRLNLIRTMPQTMEYLDANGWILLKGYNKIDDNTFPNVMAMMTGMTEQQLWKGCDPRPKSPLDDCPMLWKNFSQNGYITAYAEDIPRMGTFNSNRGGFTKPPTDYYLRPFMLAAEDKMSHGNVAGLTFCVGPVIAPDLILNYSLEFATVFRDYPTFSLFWLNAFSHNDQNTPTMVDEHVREYFKKLELTGVLNNTMVVFVSDHGMRFGKIREYYVGYLEERLPFIYFWLPESFRKAHPLKMRNLKQNINRLTSTFDLHMTLAEVLGVETTADGCPKCVSLFEEVPWDRPCIDAGITDHWCTCEPFVPYEASEEGKEKAGSAVVEAINTYLQKLSEHVEPGWRCAELSLQKVITVRTKVFIKPRDHKQFLVIVDTEPSSALFEGSVSLKNGTFEVYGLSRINSYKGEAFCIHAAAGRKFCHCERVRYA